MPSVYMELQGSLLMMCHLQEISGGRWGRDATQAWPWQPRHEPWPWRVGVQIVAHTCQGRHPGLYSTAVFHSSWQILMLHGGSTGLHKGSFGHNQRPAFTLQIALNITIICTINYIPQCISTSDKCTTLGITSVNWKSWVIFAQACIHITKHLSTLNFFHRYITPTPVLIHNSLLPEGQCQENSTP